LAQVARVALSIRSFPCEGACCSPVYAGIIPDRRDYFDIMSHRNDREHSDLMDRDHREADFHNMERRGGRLETQGYSPVGIHDKDENHSTNNRGGVAGAIALQFYIVVLMLAYFGPKAWTDPKKKMELLLWLALLVAGFVPWIYACTKSSDVDAKNATIPGLLVLVNLCMVAGVATLTHCLIFPTLTPLTPMADIPKDFHQNVSMFTHASTNALVCFSEQSRIKNLNKFLASEAEDSGIKVHSWGVAFSSLMSPWVPMGLFAVYYALCLGWDFDVFWFGPRHSKMVALDIVDCIAMYDTFFAHDPYFLFEDPALPFFSWIFVAVLWLFWNLSTLQLRDEFNEFAKHKSSDQDTNNRELLSPEVSVTPLEPSRRGLYLSVALNLCFLGLRLALRVKAQYCSPIFVVKNVLIWVPELFKILFSSGLPEADETNASTLPAKYHAMTHERNRLRQALGHIYRTAGDAVPKKDHKRDSYSEYLSDEVYYKKIEESRDKLILNMDKMMKDGGSVFKAKALANEEETKGRRISVMANGGEEAKREMKAKFLSRVEQIEAEVKENKTEINIELNYLKDRKQKSDRAQGKEFGEEHVKTLNSAFHAIQTEAHEAVFHGERDSEQEALSRDFHH